MADHNMHVASTIDDDGIHVFCGCGADLQVPGDEHGPSPEQIMALADSHAPRRHSGDRVLPPPYDTMSATDRESWLVCEGIYDGALTNDVRRANGDRPLTAWADLRPEAHQAIVSFLGQVIPILHAVAVNPAARREASDG